MCAPCEMIVAGYYDTGTKHVTICENRLGNRRAALERTLTHELIHAYDDAFGLRGQKPPLVWTDCRQRACTEIRAAALSGDCSYSAEVARGHFSPINYHQSCVRRRAALSLSMQKECKGRKEADRCVDAVFDECFANHEPFD